MRTYLLLIYFMTKSMDHCRCLAHIINLATQALISTRSKAKYYNPHAIDEHEPDTNRIDHDEIGLVRAIVVKVHY